MKLFVKLEIKQIDKEGIKGDELDESIQEAIESVDIEGWEVSGVSIERQKPEPKSMAMTFAERLLRMKPIEVEGVEHKVELDDPFPDNPTYTWRQMFQYWAEEIMKSIKSVK